MVEYLESANFSIVAPVLFKSITTLWPDATAEVPIYSKLESSSKLDFANANLIANASALGKNTVVGVNPVSTSDFTYIASMIFNSFSST